MIVVDASAVIDLLLRSSGNGLESRFLDVNAGLNAPHLIDIEIAHAFRRLASQGDITGNRGRQMLAILAALPIRRHAHLAFLGRIWDLRANITAYDAAYVALAEVLDASLLTGDRRLAQAVGHLVRTELV